MPLYIAKSGDLDRCHACLTDSQSKDSATQLLTKYKSGALVTQLLILAPQFDYGTYFFSGIQCSGDFWFEEKDANGVSPQ